MAEFLSSSGLHINCYDKNEKHLLDLKNGNPYLKFEKDLERYRKNNNDLNYLININDALKNKNLFYYSANTQLNRRKF